MKIRDLMTVDIRRFLKLIKAAKSRKTQDPLKSLAGLEDNSPKS